jgi:hypothetical protein
MLELLVILHEPLLLFRGHVPQSLAPFRRQTFHCVGIRFALLSAGIRLAFGFIALPDLRSTAVLSASRLRRQPHHERKAEDQGNFGAAH